MRLGILTIGSLFWDTGQCRSKWREEHLIMEQAQLVNAPIEYGRCSTTRGNTYTMIIRASGDADGVARLVPCRTAVGGIKDLVDAAIELWRVESNRNKSESLGASWGCVGVLFKEGKDAPLYLDWCSAFQKKVKAPISPVNDKGVLQVPWPDSCVGDSLEIDIILATATKKSNSRINPEIIADAWVGDKNGNQKYLFNNLDAGIQTIDDCSICRRILEQKPKWLDDEYYQNWCEKIVAGQAGT